MKNQIIYWIGYQIFVIIQIYMLLFPQKNIGDINSNICDVGYKNSWAILLFIGSIYILSFLKSLVNEYKQELNKNIKLYIGFSICMPIIYLLCYVITIILSMS